MTTTRSAPSASAGLIGVLRRVPPSEYQPRRSTSTAGNAPGSRRRRDVLDAAPARHVVDPAVVVGAAGAAALVEDDAAARRADVATTAAADQRRRRRCGAAGEVDRAAASRQRGGVEHAARARQAENARRGSRSTAELARRDERLEHVAVLSRQIARPRATSARRARWAVAATNAAFSAPTLVPTTIPGARRAVELGQQHRQRTGLVGAAGAAARQDQCDLLPFRHAPTLEVARAPLGAVRARRARAVRVLERPPGAHLRHLRAGADPFAAGLRPALGSPRPPAGDRRRARVGHRRPGAVRPRRRRARAVRRASGSRGCRSA